MPFLSILGILAIICCGGAFELKDAKDELVLFGQRSDLYQPVFIEGGHEGQKLTIVQITGVGAPLTVRVVNDTENILDPNLQKVDSSTYNISIELPNLEDHPERNPRFFIQISESEFDERTLAVVFIRAPIVGPTTETPTPTELESTIATFEWAWDWWSSSSPETPTPTTTLTTPTATPTTTSSPNRTTSSTTTMTTLTATTTMTTCIIVLYYLK